MTSLSNSQARVLLNLIVDGTMAPLDIGRVLLNDRAAPARNATRVGLIMRDRLVELGFARFTDYACILISPTDTGQRAVESFLGPKRRFDTSWYDEAWQLLESGMSRDAVGYLLGKHASTVNSAYLRMKAAQ